jgi:hypothetical protein
VTLVGGIGRRLLWSDETWPGVVVESTRAEEEPTLAEEVSFCGRS